MNKLRQLTQFLIGLDLVAAEQIDGWVENPRIIPSGKKAAHDSIVLYRQTYDAVITIDRFPHREHPAEELFGQVCAWLMERDGERDEIAQPRIDVDIRDDRTADIEISVEFDEDIEAVLDPAGPFLVNGERYRLADTAINYALTGEVVPSAGD